MVSQSQCCGRWPPFCDCCVAIGTIVVCGSCLQPFDRRCCRNMATPTATGNADAARPMNKKTLEMALDVIWPIASRGEDGLSNSKKYATSGSSDDRSVALNTTARGRGNGFPATGCCTGRNV